MVLAVLSVQGSAFPSTRIFPDLGVKGGTGFASVPERAVTLDLTSDLDFKEHLGVEELILDWERFFKSERVTGIEI